jgi:hypothetical protein
MSLFLDLPEQRAPRPVLLPQRAHGNIAPMGHAAVMAGRVEASDSLDFFPTPPWVARCILHEVLGRYGIDKPMSVWEPAVGAGHCAGPIMEAGHVCHASDVAEYGWANLGGPMPRQGTFVNGRFGIGLPVPNGGVDMVFTNPPFVGSVAFAERALQVARKAVVLIVRLAWLEGIERFELRQRHPLALSVNFAERVAMFQGRWDPKATSATAYAVMIWLRDSHNMPWQDGPDGLGTRTITVAPGARKRWERPHDLERFEGSFRRYDVWL